MSKARTLASTVSTGAILADGTIDAAEIGNLTLPTGGDIVGTTATQTLTNKTLTAPVLTTPNITTGLTIAGSAGTSGQVLTSAGAGSAPTWVSPAGGGSWVFISTTTASGASTVDFTGLTSTYPMYVLVGSQIIFSSTSANFLMRLYMNGTLATASYNYNTIKNANDGAGITGAGQSNQSAINVYGDTIEGTTYTGLGTDINIYVPYTTSTTQYKTVTWSGALPKTNISTFSGSGFYAGAKTVSVTGISLYPSAGTISGTFSLYGIKNS